MGACATLRRNLGSHPRKVKRLELQCNAVESVREDAAAVLEFDKVENRAGKLEEFSCRKPFELRKRLVPVAHEHYQRRF